MLDACEAHRLLRSCVIQDGAPMNSSGKLAAIAAPPCSPPALTPAPAFPDKPVTFIVPFAAGGSTDVVARIMADHMSRTLGQQIMIETVVGAGGTIGTARVAKAPADGYTVVVGSLGPERRGDGDVHQPALRSDQGLRPGHHVGAAADGGHHPQGPAGRRISGSSSPISRRTAASSTTAPAGWARSLT